MQAPSSVILLDSGLAQRTAFIAVLPGYLLVCTVSIPLLKSSLSFVIVIVLFIETGSPRVVVSLPKSNLELLILLPLTLPELGLQAHPVRNIFVAEQWWHKPLIPGRQRQAFLDFFYVKVYV